MINWHQGFWSTFVQVMAWCLVAPNHYLTKCWPRSKAIHLKDHEGYLRCNSKDSQWNIWKLHIGIHITQAINLTSWRQQNHLTHWGKVAHICASNLTIIGSDNGLSSGQHQAMIWTNAGILLIGPLRTNSEILIKIQTFSFNKKHLKVSSVQWQPFCFDFNELMHFLELVSQCW